MTLNTKRLLLRPIDERDAENIFEYAKSPNVGPNAGWKPHESIEETREIIKAVFSGQPLVFGMVLIETGKLIGTVGLLPDAKRENKRAMMLGYAMGEAYWGRGLMTEASLCVLRRGFAEEGLELVSVCCYPFNERSKGVIRKCGFQYEGRLRLCEELYDGRVLDHDCYSITRDEFLRRTEL